MSMSDQRETIHAFPGQFYIIIFIIIRSIDRDRERERERVRESERRESVLWFLRSRPPHRERTGRDGSGEKAGKTVREEEKETEGEGGRASQG